MICRPRGLGRAHLIGVNILEVHGTDPFGIPAYDPDRVHPGPSEVAGVGADPRMDSSIPSRAAWTSSSISIAVPTWGCSTGRTPSAEIRPRQHRAVDNPCQDRGVGAGADRGELHPDPAHVGGDEDLGVAQLGLHGRVPLGILDDLVGGDLVESGGVITWSGTSPSASRARYCEGVSPAGGWASMALNGVVAISEKAWRRTGTESRIPWR